ncbi:Uncharacterised protein [uncultured archaeon]|nr:Uncharacterised protein [uncultured archaeon]
MIQFCPVCGKILQIKEENGKNIGFCSCGFKRMSGIELTATEKGDGKITSTGEGIIEKDEFKEETHKIGYEEKKEMKSDF